MFLKKTKPAQEWRDGVFLCTVHDSFQADIIESKLASEGIPCIRKYEGAGNYMEVFMGSSVINDIDFYVPKDALEDAKNIIVPVDLDDCETEFEEEKEEK